MNPLSRWELREQLRAECRKRRWRMPSDTRLKVLRDAGQIPKAIPVYEKGRRGRSWLYPPETVAEYLRAEEARRSSGKRVRSWKLVQRKEKLKTILEWAHNGGTVPRKVIRDELEAVRGTFCEHPAIRKLYPYIAKPVMAHEDNRLDGAHTAIEAVLSVRGPKGETFIEPARSLAEALLRILIFRDESGDAEDVDFAELIEPIRERAGPFAFMASSLCGVVREMPLNELLISPGSLLDRFSDGELTKSANVFSKFLVAIEQLSRSARALVLNASSREAENDVRLTWGAPIAEGASWFSKQVQSDNRAWLISAASIIGAFHERNKPGALDDLAQLVRNIETLASVIEQFNRLRTAPLAAPS